MVHEHTNRRKANGEGKNEKSEHWEKSPQKSQVSRTRVGKQKFNYELEKCIE